MPRRTPPLQTVPSTEGGMLVSLDDSLLPRSIINRLAKASLPDGTMIQKDAVLAILKSATVFVGRLCDEANEKAKAGGKKTILPKDILEAVKEMEFEEFVPRMEKELKKFEEKMSLKRAKKGGPENAGGEGSNDQGEGRPAKKARTETNGAGGAAGALGSGVEDGGDDAVDDAVDDEDILDEEDDILDDEEEEEEEEFVEDETIDQDLVEDVDPVEDKEEDEALDNGHDSD